MPAVTTVDVDAGASLTLNGNALSSYDFSKTGAGQFILTGNQTYGDLTPGRPPYTQSDGDVLVRDGAHVTAAGASIFGDAPGNSARMIVSGDGTRFQAGTTQFGHGTNSNTYLRIEAGATWATTGNIHIATSTTATGARPVIEVIGKNALMDVQNQVLGGIAGSATIRILDGGRLQSGAVQMGGSFFRDGPGDTVVISGADSAWTSSSAYNFYRGELWIADGGVLSANAVNLASSAGRTVEASVSGVGSSIASKAGNIAIAGTGTAELTLSDGALLDAQGGAGLITLASGAAGNGTLNIGGAGAAAAQAAGTINAQEVRFGAGTGVVNFNHTDSDYVLGMPFTGNGTLNQIGTGRTTLNGDNSAFTGITNVTNGILSVNDTLGGTMNVLGGRLQGVGTIGTTTHGASGIIAPGNSIGVLTIAGDYVGNGGLIEIETVLGGDGSSTDLLRITGNTSGTSDIKVINVGGTGAPTVEGIKIIEVGGASDGVFSLKGDYVLDGEQAVVAGAYAYRLYQNGVSTPADGDWYLRSALKPVDPQSQPQPLYQAGVPVYEAYAGTLLGLNGMPTLQQRIGNRYWTGAGNASIAQSDGPSAAESGSVTNSGIPIWGRIEGAHSKFEPKTSTSAADYDLDTWKMQAGLDGQLHEGDGGRLISGFTVHYGKASAHVSSEHGNGKIAIEKYGFGGTLTWYDSKGFYVDGQAVATWYDSDLVSKTASTGLVDGNHAFGYVLSVETGQRFSLGPNWALTPQAQLAYASVDFDNFTDAFGARVSLADDDSLKGRLGIAANYEDAWYDADGKIVRTHLYGIGNLYHELLDGASVNVSGVNFASKNDRTWGGIGAGGSYNWSDDKYSLYGEVSLDTSLSNIGDSYSVNGTVGFRMKW